MKINWKIRFQNPLWWWRLILAIVVPIISYFGLTVENLDSWSILGQTLLKAVSNPYVLGLTAVSVWNTVIDPTTKGFGDNEITLYCKVPNTPYKKQKANNKPHD